MKDCPRHARDILSESNSPLSTTSSLCSIARYLYTPGSRFSTRFTIRYLSKGCLEPPDGTTRFDRTLSSSTCKTRCVAYNKNESSSSFKAFDEYFRLLLRCTIVLTNGIFPRSAQFGLANSTKTLSFG